MVKLDRIDEEFLKGRFGEAAAKAMEIIVTIAEALDAKQLIPIVSAHVSGISVSNIGEAGVLLIEELASGGGKVRVPAATVNPIGFDVYGLLPRTHEEWELQSRVIKALQEMGFRNILSCTPYDYGNRPTLGSHIAWAESSAVLYANSVLGAYTNREGGIVALAAALTGRIYEWGVHIKEERVPHVRLEISDSIDDELLGGLVGAFIGIHIEGIPLLKGSIAPDELLLRNLLAAAGAWGNHSLIYIPGVTPEYEKVRHSVTRSLSISKRDVLEVLDRVGGLTDEPDAIFIGCPHVHRNLVNRILEKIRECGGSRIPFYIATCGCIERQIVEQARKLNVMVLAGTCPVVSNLSRWGVKRLATNSMKAAFYLPRRHNVEVMLGNLHELVAAACSSKR